MTQPNSLRMYVEDAMGDQYLFTCASNREGQETSFRKHAAWWTRTGHRNNPRGPVKPFKIVVEPYHDATAF